MFLTVFIFNRFCNQSLVHINTPSWEPHLMSVKILPVKSYCIELVPLTTFRTGHACKSSEVGSPSTICFREFAFLREDFSMVWKFSSLKLFQMGQFASQSIVTSSFRCLTISLEKKNLLNNSANYTGYYATTCIFCHIIQSADL